MIIWNYYLINYFNKFYDCFLKEYFLPVRLKEEFFIQYCKLFLNENINKINIIIKILKKYNTNLKENSKVNVESELYSYYYDTAIYLINNHKLINSELIEFISNEPSFLINNKITLENIQNGIIVDGKDIEFTNNLLNNTFKGINLKKLFNNDYNKFIENIFNKFIIPKDLLAIMDWNINENVPEEVVSIFLKAIKRIWLNDPKNHMYGLEDLIAKEFGVSSLKVYDYKMYIDAIENTISNDKLLVIYSEILNRNFKASSDFKSHIIKYIHNNNIYGPLSIWYLLVTINDKYTKYNFLENNLSELYAVKTEDFIHYRAVIEDRILLYINLYKGNYLETLKRTDYFIKSVKSKDYFDNLKFKDTMIIYKNILDIQQLLLFFTNERYEKNKEETNFIIGTLLIDFSEKCELSKKHYESLKIVLNFWNRFFPCEKINERNNLKYLIEEYENTPLKEYYNLYNKTEWFLGFLDEAKISDKLYYSIIFMEIYEQSKNKFNKNDERSRYNYTFNEFNKLKILLKNSNIDLLENSLKENIIISVYKNLVRFYTILF